MKETSVDQKLELIRQVRSQYQQNQTDLLHRESILYDRPYRNSSDTQFSDINIKEGSQKDGTLKIRYLLAALFTVIIILCHRTDIDIAGVTMEQVFLTLEEDYEDVIMAWSNSLIKTSTYSQDASSPNDSSSDASSNASTDSQAPL